jgi:hypothetical protein
VHFWHLCLRQAKAGQPLAALVRRFQLRRRRFFASITSIDIIIIPLLAFNDSSRYLHSQPW